MQVSKPGHSTSPASSTNSENPVSTPSSTPSDASDILREATSDDGVFLRASVTARLLESTAGNMDGAPQDRTTIDGDPAGIEQPSTQTEHKSEDQVNGGDTKVKSKKSSNRKKHAKHSKHAKKSRKAKELSTDDDSDGSSSNDDSDEDEDSDSDDSSSEDEKRKQRKKKARRRKPKAKGKKRKSKRRESPDSNVDTDDSDDESSDESSEEEDRRKRHRKRRRSKRQQEDEDADEEAEDEDGEAAVDANESTNLQQLQRLMASLNAGAIGRSAARNVRNTLRTTTNRTKPKKKKKRAGKRGSTLEFKRVDELWDSSIHNYKLKESAEDDEDEFNEYVFTVRRKFDWENKYRSTVVDIKSSLLKEALQEVMKDVKGVSLVEEQPSVDPNMLFLYCEELKAHMKTLKKKQKKEKKKKGKKRVDKQRSHCKVLLKYLNQDYDEVKKTLYPMLKAGNITFDLLWALFKPNTIAFTNTYGSTDDPRCFKVDYANKECSFMKGEWYCIEGRYLEYDGKNYGMGDFEVNVDSFKGPRKITSLLTYPLQYHKEPEELKKKLVERGKAFVAMEGMNYRFHKGLAFQKRKKTVAKVNINGRIMVDPAIFRRINPNYQISQIQAKDDDDYFEMSESDGDASSSCCCCDNTDEDEGDLALTRTRSGMEKEEKDERTKYKVVVDNDNNPIVVEVPVDENGAEIRNQKLENLEGSADGKTQRQFTEEELLIASPVVLGFAFSEKLWLEFSLSGVRDIEWDEHAFEALVMPTNHKRIVKALVESHKFHAAKTIDDVIQGKGKGLVSVLHGPPGTGKTLTAEGIAELLKCPLYMVSAGELGTDPARLEHELQKILDIAHSWGAVLLLDEADVFLERREIHDIHRNALVSVFLRLLEYFQGILFLTTNRVETFDDAIQSRVHVALRYVELDHKARKEVWKMFVEKCRAVEGVQTATFEPSDFETLARKTMNGRQVRPTYTPTSNTATNTRDFR